MSFDFVSILVFVLALSGMIFVHEFGHFVAARFFNIEVEEFGFGLPSIRLATLFTWRGTAFTVHALPLGGFVRPKGENDPNVPGGLAAAAPWKRIAVLLSGPLMNLLTAVVVFAMITAFEGVVVAGPVRLEKIAPNSPAEQAGLRVNDVIVAINGQPVDQTRDISLIIQENLDKPLELKVQRGDQIVTITATPLSSRLPTQGPLGITMVPATRPATPVEIGQAGFTRTALQAAAIVYLPIALIQGAINPSDARPVGLKGIFDLVDVAVQEDTQSRQTQAGQPARPTYYTLLVIGLLSVSLGVINLLPIPALDGGRILFTLPELLFHRRIPPETENIINGVGLLLLIILMLYINAMDILKPTEILLP
ncbi:MAG TPA: M50 family metallopeptidase [Anaerolineales bacterium]|jgi:regulator of sigma E protease